MKNLKKLIDHLNKDLERELAQIIRYLHHSFIVEGPSRGPLVGLFRQQAQESMTHAVKLGEKITALGGHPSIKVQPVPETNEHNVLEILKESLEFEKNTIKMYHALLEHVHGNVALEEMVRGLIADEVSHVEEVEKMCRK